MMNSVRRNALMTALLSVMSTLAPTVSGAQQAGTLASRCEVATQAVRTSPADALAAGHWASATVCGVEGGRALAGALRTMAQEADTRTLQQVEVTLSRFRDAALLDAAIAVATSATATPAVRSLSLRLLAVQHWSDMLFVSPLSLEETSGRCRTMTVVGRQTSEGAPLPADYPQRISDAAGAVSVDASAPADLQLLARCVKGVVQSALPRIPDFNKIAITHICGRQFRIENKNAFGVLLSYTLAGTDETGTIGVNANSTRRFTTEEPGTLRVTYEGQSVALVVPSATPCGSGT